ncbi:F-box domain, cyclin-like protein [Artemisia annua]|uniref:F-box domain, cyclin-like protein n=1 Tax=Artemisia annua TaxID=35608 RepID=A0A2U1QEG9_ARTAN|nr:F-box domain, cyclin-like protein [Artemisia annua]
MEERCDCFGYGRERVDKGGGGDTGSGVDIIDLLPSDPFGMDIDISTTFTAINGWLEDLDADFGVYVRNSFGNTREDYGLFSGINLIMNHAMKFQSFPSNEAPDSKGGAGFMVDNSTTGFQFSGVTNHAMRFQSFPSNAAPDIKGGSGVMVDNSTTGFQFSDVMNHAMKFQSFPSNEAPDIKGGSGFMVDDSMTGFQFRDVMQDDIMGFDYGSTSAHVTTSEDHSPSAAGGDPHEAFFLALSYLETKDLLLVERVSRSLCSTIHNDSLLWRSIHIDQPLNERITDDVLVQLTNRAEGNLVSLSLIKCTRITDDGLKRVLETNPKLTKLSIPGCTRLSSEGILKNLKSFNSTEGTSGIKHIRTGGFYGITHDQFNEVKCLLNTGGNKHQNSCLPHYYHRGNSYQPSDDDRDIDVEVCPRCQNVRLVYDCPADSCQVKDQCVALCRACIHCIPRCAQCGRCVHNSEYEETFSLEYLCSECLKEMPRCEEAHEMNGDVYG